MDHQPRLARFVLGALLIALGVTAQSAGANDFPEDRNRMVDESIVAAGVSDPRVIQSMRDTPRHEFMPAGVRSKAYFDMGVAIGEGQTISPPFIVAYMTEQLLPKATDKVLEIGTGSGYQAAVLSPLVKDVYTIEIVKHLGTRAAATLKRLKKYGNVHTKIGDGYQGWPEHAPFDKIIVTCSPEDVPPKLVEQLREGGRMLVPTGKRYDQTLYLFQKEKGELKRVALLPMLFVPMTGKAEAGRVELPDPLHPAIGNGGFEETRPDPRSAEGASKDPEKKNLIPTVWYYQTQLQLVEASDAPEGKYYVTFANGEADRGAHALQGMPVDGRKVDELEVSVWVKAKNLRPGSSQDQVPVVGFRFYDENRAQIGYTFVGPWRDTFSWQHVSDTIHVPVKAREAIIFIGLGGATGEISFDDLQVRAVK